MRLAETTSSREVVWGAECEVWRYELLFLLLIAGIVLAKGRGHSVLTSGVQYCCRIGTLQGVTLASVTLTFFEI